LTKDAKLLLTVAMLSVAGMSIATTFVNVFLIRATEGNIILMILQNMTNFITLLCAYVIGSKLLVKIPITTILKLGVGFMSLYYIAILILQENVANFLIPLGVFSGAGSGLFWFSTNLLIGHIVKEDEQGRYFSYQQIAGFVLGIITPALSGFIIMQFTDLTGYYLLFCVALIFFAIATLMVKRVSGFVVAKKIRVIEVLKLKNNRYWRACKFFNFTVGLRMAIDGQILMVFAFLIFANEQVMGNFTSINALISVASALWFAKILTREKQGFFYLIIAILMMLANIVLALFPHRIILIGVWIIFAIVRNWSDTIFRSMTFQLCSRAKDGFKQNEYLVALEFPMALGRIIGLSVALVLTFLMYSDIIAYRILFAIIGCVWIIEYIIIETQVKWLKAESKNNGVETLEVI